MTHLDVGYFTASLHAVLHACPTASSAASARSLQQRASHVTGCGVAANTLSLGRVIEDGPELEQLRGRLRAVLDAVLPLLRQLRLPSPHRPQPLLELCAAQRATLMTHPRGVTCINHAGVLTVARSRSAATTIMISKDVDSSNSLRGLQASCPAHGRFAWAAADIFNVGRLHSAGNADSATTSNIVHADHAGNLPEAG